MLLLGFRGQCALDIEAGDTADPGDQLGHRLTDMSAQVADLRCEIAQPREGFRRESARVSKVEERIAQRDRLNRIGARDRLVECIEDVVGRETVGTPSKLSCPRPKGCDIARAQSHARPGHHPHHLRVGNGIVENLEHAAQLNDDRLPKKPGSAVQLGRHADRAQQSVELREVLARRRKDGDITPLIVSVRGLHPRSPRRDLRHNPGLLLTRGLEQPDANIARTLRYRGTR